ncbi:MAG: polysulfide reductase [Bacteroidetes bacterium]|jgi:Ni/Fe-hydrogenase subunit HybB-like protein|nr:polysulfide reductase [Bacteroidota bacterium]|tara:strand:- start:203 stop:1399 length:1197 start_codon:yes stop_codon:yes gene_type:complete
MDKNETLYEALANLDGYIYPNEIALNWDLLIVMYPYVTGLVAGAFILASLNRVFDIKALRPTYEISLLTALSFMLVATMPLITHLGQPWRFYEMLVTPHLTSAMAIFGFVYLWYLMVVLLLEIWFDYRYDMVIWSQQKKGFMRFVYKVLCLWVFETSPKSRKTDEKIGYFITVVGIPSAFLLHGYVGFIFGSIKANPWWSTVMMPVIFIFSAMVSGIALVMFIYMGVSYLRKQKPDMLALDTIAKYLLYILIIDFTLESLDQIHRIYEADESFDILKILVRGKLFFTFFIMQIGVGVIIPVVTLGIMQFKNPREKIRRIIYWIISICVLVGIFYMRWNVVIGGQLFSKSFYGFTSYKVNLIGGADVWLSVLWFVVPFIILAILLWLLPPWKKAEELED